MPIELVQVKLLLGLFRLVRAEIPHQIGKATRSAQTASFLLRQLGIAGRSAATAGRIQRSLAPGTGRLGEHVILVLSGVVAALRRR